MDERPIPNAALLDSNATEMIRVWIAQRSLHCSIKVGIYRSAKPFSEADAWGILLADITRHVASALNERYNDDKEGAVKAIVESYEKEILQPTSPIAGGFAGKKS